MDGCLLRDVYERRGLLRLERLWREILRPVARRAAEELDDLRTLDGVSEILFAWVFDPCRAHSEFAV